MDKEKKEKERIVYRWEWKKKKKRRFVNGDQEKKQIKMYLGENGERQERKKEHSK